MKKYCFYLLFLPCLLFIYCGKHDDILNGEKEKVVTPKIDSLSIYSTNITITKGETSFIDICVFPNSTILDSSLITNGNLLIEKKKTECG